MLGEERGVAEGVGGGRVEVSLGWWVPLGFGCCI